MKPIYWLLIISFLGFASCKSKKKMEDSSTQVTKVADEPFDVFYDLFHKDIDFQMSRIKFPLEGDKVKVSSQAKWSKENWTPMKTKIYDIKAPNYKTTYNETDHSFYQKVWIEDSGFMSEYRFDKINGKWYLTYAKEVDM